MNEINIYRGDTASITISVVDEDSVAFDLTGYTMKLSAKESVDDTEYVIEKTAVIASPTDGIGIISLESDDTDIDANGYYYDVEITKLLGDVIVDRKTVIFDRIVIKNAISED